MQRTTTSRARGVLYSALAFITFAVAGSSPALATFQSDDFHAAELDTTRWTVIDPLGDATFRMTGTNLLVHVPGRAAHTLWNTCACAPMLVQPVPDDDMALEAKFDAAVTAQYQMQGFVVREDDDTFLRFDVHYNGGNVRIFAAYVNGVNPPSVKINTSLGSLPPYLRVSRAGDTWEFSYSTDGSSWTSAGSFSRLLTVSDAGVFVGNEAIDPYETPAFTASIDYVFNSASPISPEDGGDSTAVSPPQVDLWYGDNQDVGHLGVPQDFANVQGTVWGPHGIASLAYSLNGGAGNSLNVGPDGARLVGFGDFNAEIAYDDLLPGANDVVISVTDTLGATRDTTVTLNYTDGVVWALPDTAAWSTAGAISDEAHVVDGQWILDGSGIRTAPFTAGYERLLVAGDRTWTPDYEVMLPFTVHEGDLGGDTSVELVVGWEGHTGAGQPRVNGNFQALAGIIDFTTTPTLQLRTTGAIPVGEVAVTATEGPTYYLKLRTQRLGGGESRVSTRFWADGQPEPGTWDIEGNVTSRDGSVLLMANNADVTFGDVVFTPLPRLGYVLDTSVAGGGTVLRSPNYTLYPESTEVALTAIPDSTWVFAGWSGGVTSEDAGIDITVVSDTAVTATFVPAMVSDDFYAGSLDAGLWRVMDPVGDTELRMTGTNLLFDLTGGISHDLWSTCNCAPRILQPSSDTDFQVEVKFDSRGHYLYQSQGIVVHEDDDTFLRFDMLYTPGTVKLFSAIIDGATASSRLNHTPVVEPSYLRVTRTGDLWTFRYSDDGSSWYIAGSYTQVITVTEAGVFAANHNDDVYDTPAYVASVDYFMNTAAPIVPEDGGQPSAETPPIVDVWYGNTRDVGQRGAAEDWWNVLGQVIDPDSIVTLSYTLNGGASTPLSMGPDDLRLDGVGDFVVEIADADLVAGPNTVVITAIDELGEQTDEMVTLNYMAGGWWDLGYSADFSTAGTVTDVAEPVTGLWTITADGVRTAPGRTGYDRLLAIGNHDWITSYEAEGTLVIHEGNIGGMSGIGYIAGWQGHQGAEQPRDNPPFQSAGWIRDFPDNTKLELRDDEVVRGAVNVAMELDSLYHLKLRSEYVGPTLRQVSVKVWADGSAEPGWQLTDQFTARDGSLLLVAHEADVTFGDLTITPLAQFPDNVLTVNTAGSGTVVRNPAAPSYLDGTAVALTAIPDPGWVFTAWTGALSGSQQQDTLVIDTDTTVTAIFTQDQYVVDVSIFGNGQVTRAPDKPFYSVGEVVVLTAAADSGWTFCEWTGDLKSESAIDSLTVTGNHNVTAVFGVYGLEVSIVGTGEVSMSPNKSFYAPGEQVVLTAHGLSAMVFDSWGGDLVSTDNPDTVTVDSTLSIVATFVDTPLPIGDTPSLTRLTLGHNSPNPFTVGTFFNFGLPTESDVEISVYDAAGRRVYSERIVRSGPGWHQLYFDGRDGRGRSLPSGVYFYRVTTSYASVANKMVIVR